MSSSSEDEDDGRYEGKGKQSKKTANLEQGGRAVYSLLRNAANGSKSREMFKSGGQLLELAAKKDQKGLDVDVSFSTSTDRKGTRHSMLTTTSETYPKGATLTWQVLALQGESNKHATAIARRIVEYVREALRFVRKQSQLDSDDLDDQCKTRRGDAPLGTLVASLAAIQGETAKRPNQIFAVILRMLRSTVEVPVSLDTRAAELRQMHPHKYASIVHWCEALTRFLEMASSEMLQAAQRDKKVVPEAVDELVLGIGPAYIAVFRGPGSLMCPLRTEIGDLAGGEGAYSSSKSLAKSNQMLEQYPALRKAIEDDAHGGADRRLGEEGKEWVTAVNVNNATHPTFMRHMGTTVRSSDGATGSIFQDLIALDKQRQPKGSQGHSVHVGRMDRPTRSKWEIATSVKQPPANAGDQVAAAGSKRSLEYDNAARLSPEDKDYEGGQDPGWTPGRWPKRDDEDRGSVDPGTPSANLSYGYADAEWGAEYSGESKSHTYGYKSIARLLTRAWLRKRNAVSKRSLLALAYNAASEQPSAGVSGGPSDRERLIRDEQLENEAATKSKTEVIFEVLTIHQELQHELLSSRGSSANYYKDMKANHQVRTAMAVARLAAAIDANGKMYGQSADELVEGVLELCDDENARTKLGAAMLKMVLHTIQLIICRLCDARVEQLKACSDTAEDPLLMRIAGGEGHLNHKMIEALVRAADEERKVLHGAIRTSTKGGAKKNDKKNDKKKKKKEKAPEAGKDEKVRGAIALREGDASAPCDVCGDQSGDCRSVKKPDGNVLVPNTVMTLCPKGQIVMDASFTDDQGMRRGFCLNCKGFCYGRAKHREQNPDAPFRGSRGCVNQKAAIVTGQDAIAVLKKLGVTGKNKQAKSATTSLQRIYGKRGGAGQGYQGYRGPDREHRDRNEASIRGATEEEDRDITPDEPAKGVQNDAEIRAMIAKGITDGIAEALQSVKNQNSETVSSNSSESIGHVKKMKKKEKSQATLFNEARSERTMKARIAKAKEQAEAQVARLVKEAEEEHEKNLAENSTEDSESESE